MQELRLFLQEHADKADSYEIWGGSKRPSSGAVLTMGTLRDVYRSHLRPAFAGDDTALPPPTFERLTPGDVGARPGIAYEVTQCVEDDAPPSTSR